MPWQELDSTVHVIDDDTTKGPAKAKAKEPEPEVEIEIEGAASAAPKELPKEEDLEIEVQDDTPEADRGKEPAPEVELTEDELKEYSKRVQGRIKQLQRKAHDERRAKEAIDREKAELQRLAQQLWDENNQLKSSAHRSQTALVDQTKTAAQLRLDKAKKEYREAYEAGDTDRVVAAQQELTAAQIHVERVNSVRVPPLQDQKPVVQQRQQPTQPVADPKAVSWAEKNTWFGTDDEMTSFALGYHSKLVKEGVDPQSEEYYEKLDSRLKQVFPDKFGGARSTSTQRQPRPNVVAPATRSQAPKKVTLTQTQVNIAKRLGVPLAEYARHYAATMNGEPK